LSTGRLGGKTEFDQLSGQVEMNADGYEFTDLEIGSGLFKASGDVAISNDHQLDGLIAAEVKGTASLVSIPFDVSGTVGDPTLLPSKGAMAGALTGSALLPGIGTAVGMKAGQIAERMFARKKKKTEPQPAKPAEAAKPSARPGRQ